ncbi:PLDc N-terminal domain-containing protein [Candidatus Woesearchaeota archaeon]|nr:PLDc N-terminal domain-containing protein [Candidatus Woesearchaeota archaeon]
MWPVYNGMLGFGLVGIILVLLFAIFWVWMLVDAVTRDFKNDTEKVVWVLVIIFTHILGALIYYLVVNLREKSSRKRRR